MSSQSLVDELVTRWLDGGRRIPTEELCRNHPELVDRVREGKAAIAAYEDSRHGPCPQLPPRYQNPHWLGQGGMSVVWQATDTQFNRPVAVKIPNDNSQRTSRRFMHEVQVSARLEHPGIVPVYEVGVLGDGRRFLAMRLVHGHNLKQLLNDRAAPRDRLARFLEDFAKICETIAYAHSEGVIHRDLKPGNVMVGKFGQVYVIDWGVSKVLNHHEVAAETTSTLPPSAVDVTCAEEMSRSGQLLGTLVYMSPEQARGQVALLDKRCDVFGLGAILCEILTGRPPHLGTEVAEVLARAQAGDLAECVARLDGCGADPELIGLAKDCLQPQPDHRPSDGQEVANRISAYLADQSQKRKKAEIAAATAEARIASERKARWFAVGVALAVATAIFVGGGWWVQHGISEQHAALNRLALDRTNRMFEILEEDGLVQDMRLDSLRYEVAELYGEFAKRNPIKDRDSVEKELAKIRERLAVLTERLGRLPKALDEWTIVQAEWNKLRRRMPGDADVEERLAFSTLAQGQLLLRMERIPEATATLIRAREALRLLHEHHPANGDILLNLAEAEHQLADLYADKLGDFKQAKSHHDAALGYRTRLVETPQAFPQRSELSRSPLVGSVQREFAYKNDLARTFGYLGDMYRNQGNLRAAQEAYKKAEDLRQELVEKAPKNNEFRFQLARSKANTAWYYMESYRLPEAISQFELCEQERMKLVRDNPHAAEYIADLAYTQSEIAALLMYQGTANAEEAKKWLTDSMAHYKKLAECDRALWDEHAWCLMLQARLEERDRAKEYLAEAREAIKKAPAEPLGRWYSYRRASLEVLSAELTETPEQVKQHLAKAMEFLERSRREYNFYNHRYLRGDPGMKLLQTHADFKDRFEALARGME